MGWIISHLNEDNIVHVKMLRPINLEETKQLCIEANLSARQHQSHKYLIDHRGVDIALSVLDIDKIPDAFKELGADFNGKTAIVLDSSESKVNLFNFLKNVLSLVSMHFELFSDNDKAVGWLQLQP
jgi:hypothetical protein